MSNDVPGRIKLSQQARDAINQQNGAFMDQASDPTRGLEAFDDDELVAPVTPQDALPPAYENKEPKKPEEKLPLDDDDDEDGGPPSPIKGMDELTQPPTPDEVEKQATDMPWEDKAPENDGGSGPEEAK